MECCHQHHRFSTNIVCEIWAWRSQQTRQIRREYFRHEGRAPQMQEYLTTHTEHGHEPGHWNQSWGSVTQDLEVLVHVMSVLSAFASLVDSESSIYIYLRYRFQLALRF